jgi:DNA-binding MarR family transcriptional regulator
VDSASGLNAPRLSALSAIVFAGPITLGRLAEAEQVRPPTMTRIVAALVELGLVAKNRDAADRRAIQLSATARGRKLLLAGRDRRVASLAEALRGLNAEDRSALETALPILHAVLQGL